MRKSILYNWWLSGRNKNNILLYIGGQSNEGTDPDSGRVDTLMPSYLTSPSYTNVFFWDIDLANDYDFEAYVPNFPTRLMGYVDQIVYILSQVYENVYVVKRANTGTQLYPPTGGEVAYPEAQMIDRGQRARLAIESLHPNDFDEVMMWGQGESDADNATEANAYKANLLAFISDFNTAIGNPNLKWILRRQGNLTAIDFPFIDTVNQAKDEIASENGYLTANADGLRTLSDIDDAHFSASGCIALGGKVTSKILQTVGRSKPDNTKPILQSATVDSTGLLVTLVFSKTINPGINIYPFQFAIGDRTISSAVQSGANVVLTLKSPVRIGDTDTLSYTKDLYYSENIQDLLSNEVDSFTGFTLTNNSTVVAREVSFSLYESNFATVDGWANVSGATVTANETVDGVSGCLKITSTAATAIAEKSIGTFVSSYDYRITYDLYTSPTFGKDVNGRNVFFGIVTPSLTVMDMDNLYIRGEWQSYQIDITSTGGQILRFSNQFSNVGDFIAIKNLKVERLTKVEAPATPYSSQLQAVVTRAESEAITQPPTYVLNALDEFLRGLDTDGLLTDMVSGSIWHSGSANFGRINLNDGAGNLNTISGTLAFTRERGVKSSSSSYVQLALKSDAYANIESNFTDVFYVSESSTVAGSQSAYGARVRSATGVNRIVQPRYSGANGNVFSYDATLDAYSNTENKGLYVNTVTTTNKVLYKDGVKLANIANTKVAPDISVNVHLLANNSATTSNTNTPANFWTKADIACFFSFRVKFDDTKESLFRSRFNTYRTRVELL